MVYNNQIAGWVAPVQDAVGPFPLFSSTERLLTKGNLRGHYLETPREPVRWNPVEQKNDKLLQRTSYLCVGSVGSGKSSFGKIAAFEDSAVVESGRPGRVYGINMRPIANQDEYGMLAMFMGAEMNSLSRRFNPFSPNLRFTLSDHLATAVSIHESATSGEAPRRYMKQVMRVAIAQMFSEEGWRGRRPGVSTYTEIVLGISKEQAIEHIKNVLKAARADNSKQGFDINAEIDDGITAGDVTKEEELDITNVNWDEFMQDAGAVAVAALDFVDGEFGGIVGGDDPLDINSDLKRFFGLNIAYFQDKVKAFIVEYLLRLKDVAARSGDERFMFDIELWDELHELWNFPGIARAFPRMLKYKRGNSTVLYSMTQDLRDFKAAKYSTAALNTITDYGAIVIAQLESEKSVDFMAEYVELTSYEKRAIMSFGPGQYGIKFPKKPLQIMQIDLNPVRRHLIETDIASIEALRRRRAYVLEGR